MSDEQLEKIIRDIKHENKSVENSLKALSIMALPKQSKLDPDELMEKYLTNSEHFDKQNVKYRINQAREDLDLKPSSSELVYQYDELKRWIKLPENEKQGNTYNTPRDNDDKKDQVDEERVRANFKANADPGKIEKLSKAEEFVLRKGLRKIIQNRSIGKTHNSLEGKLASKRLGRYPNTYLFKKKTRPSPETTIYILADLSGSMTDDDKLKTVSAYINSIRDIDIKDLKVELRGFNLGYFKNEEIPRPFNKLLDHCLKRIDPETHDAYAGTNADGFYLQKIMEEIRQDTCENKCLIILSDGQPAPHYSLPRADLKKVVNGELVKSNIPYISIGIMDETVKDFYPKAKVAKSTTELAAMLSKYSRELIKF